MSLCENKSGKIRVACVGDSITRGEGQNSYPEFLKNMLSKDYEVMNFGAGGTTASKNGYMRLPELDGYNHAYVNVPEYDESLRSKPDVVIIMFGTNDSKMQNWFYDYDYKSPDKNCERSKQREFYSDYRELVEVYMNLKPAPKVIFATSCVVFDDWVSEERVLAGDHILGEVMKNQVVPCELRLAEDLGLYLVDIFSFTEKNKADGAAQSADGLHPNLAYEKLAARFARAVKEVCEK